MSLPPLPKPDLEGVDYELWGQNAQADCWFEAKVRAYAAAAVEAEREACARAVEQYGGAWDEATQAFARLIRARSTASNSAKAKSAGPPAPRAPSDLCR